MLETTIDMMGGAAPATAGGNRILRRAAVLSILALASTTGAAYDPIQVFNNPGPADNTGYGISLADLGTTFAVGAPFDNAGDGNAGAVFQYNSTTGALVRTINNPDPEYADRFGWAVAAIGTNLAISAYQNSSTASRAGTVYIYDGAATGTLLLTIENPNPDADDLFGHAIAAVGNNLLIGAPQDDFGGTDAGRAYLFNGTTGALMFTFNNPSPDFLSGDNFGMSVAAVGSDIVIGEPGDDTAASDAGRVHLFSGTTGLLIQSLGDPMTLEAGDRFGTAVAGLGSNILASAIGNNIGGIYAGTVYLINGYTNTLVRFFDNPTPVDGERFGWTLSTLGGNVLVGVPDEITGGASAGSAYLFNATTGALMRTFNNPAPAPYDYMGYAVSPLGANIMSSIPRDNLGSGDIGSVQVINSTTGAVMFQTTNPSKASDGGFGRVMTEAGGNILFGARDEGDVVGGSGAAYLLDGVTGAVIHTFTDPSPVALENFGNAVAAKGGSLFIGAPYDEQAGQYLGAVYEYDASTGALIRKITDPIPNHGAAFGESLANATAGILIGARGNEVLPLSDVGSVFLYDTSLTTITLQVNNPSTVPYDYFGYSVAESGTNILVGAPGDDTTGADSGRAYLFDGTSGALLHIFENPTALISDQFGHAVAAAPGKIIVSAVSDDTAGIDTGSVYVFDDTTWSLLFTVTNPLPAGGDGFGDSLAAAGGMMLVGAPLQNWNGIDSGAAFIVSLANGSTLKSISNPYPEAYDNFGDGVAFIGGRVMIGAPHDNLSQDNEGAAYLYPIPQNAANDWNLYH